MGNQGLKYAALGAVLLAIVLGVVAYRMTLSATEAARQEARAAAEATEREQAETPTTLAVIALRPLAATRPITGDDVAIKPVSVVPERYFTRVEDVLGRAPLIDVDAGAPVTPRYFRDTNVLARLIPKKHQAMSLEVSDIVAVGGFVRPGDEVDLLLFIRDAGRDSQARVLLERVLVLAYEDRIIERPEGLTEAEGRSERRSRVRTAVVAIPEAQTTKVMLGASLGDIRLSLHRQTVADEDLDERLLPPAADRVAEKAPDSAKEEDRSKAITLAELTRLKAKQDKPKPPPYVIQVFRGSESQKVTD